MKVAVWYGGKDIRIEEKPKPGIKVNQVLVRVRAVGVCGSELHAYEGISRRRKPPLIMGHEFAGEVAEVRKEVKGIQESDRVVIEPIIRCGTCEQCISGRSNICINTRLIGLHTNGAFAEFVAVPVTNQYKIPDNISFEEASLVEPFSVGIHAVNLSSIKIGDYVAVVGDGVIGLTTLQAAKLAGAGRLIVIGHHDYRLNMARQLGADVVINSEREDPVNKITKLSDAKGVDVVVEAVGSRTAVQQSMAMVKKGGVVTLVGMLEKTMELEMLNVVTEEIEIKGSYGFTSRDFKSALDLISAGKLNARSLITHVFPLDHIKKGFEILAKREKGAIKVVIQP